MYDLKRNPVFFCCSSNNGRKRNKQRSIRVSDMNWIMLPGHPNMSLKGNCLPTVK